MPHVRAGIIYMYNVVIDNCGMSTEKTKLTSNIVNWCKKKKAILLVSFKKNAMF